MRLGTSFPLNMESGQKWAERYFFHEEFLEETFDLLHGKIRSCHLKDILLLPEYTFRLKECACGEGTLNIEKYSRACHNYGPPGYKSLASLDSKCLVKQ